MTAILHGNLRAEIAGHAGVRLQRVRSRRAAGDLLRPRQPDAPRKPLMRGGEREAADAFATIAAGQPAGFYAACGYGKTTLLRYVAAERGLGPRCLYLRADGNRVGDQLEDAYQLLGQALTLREQIGDAGGADVTRHNLRLLTMPEPPSAHRSAGRGQPDRPRRLRRIRGAVRPLSPSEESRKRGTRRGQVAANELAAAHHRPG
jgi:hypothetical protein